MKTRPYTLQKVQKRLRSLYWQSGQHTKDGKRSWHWVARQLGLSVGTVIRISQDGYEPKRSDIRRALGLPLYATVQVCQHCGQVHPPRRRHVSSNPALLKSIRKTAVPFLVARENNGR